MNEKTAIQVLVDAKALINAGWAQGAFARHANGVRTGSMDEKACFFCAEGAICRAAFGTVYARREAMRAIQQAAGRCDIFRWNDNLPDGRRGKKIVAEAFDRAIDALGGDPSAPPSPGTLTPAQSRRRTTAEPRPA